ncbi:hypothetical protein GCM10011490_00970 [Pseudoclavibacter endophyticus]|uniref:Uncharacterized protein n=1 Tax=Pseudoclavibacter endophyticus TaxID=1778590 RepID=A0A6H9WV15_9MICO|nr:hypothetical protein [Pseudoclavibacter endophyticus]KAB1650344.1 hypothetical protein F8O04_09220 [Pseudoclavibacter endophyticus]GGA54963.1 hypothetical protein GCM10011490_00970 [Pseudoclavibacter endophyticus]
MAFDVAAAQAAVNARDYDRALARCDDAESRAASGGTPLSPPERASVHGIRAQVHHHRERYAEAAAERERQLELLIASEASPARVADIRASVAWARFKCGDAEAAAAAAGIAYIEREVELGRDDPKTLSTLSVWIYSLNRLERYDEMVDLAEELYQRRVATMPADSAEVVDAAKWLAYARAKAGDA